jgi:hypothetical protein
MTKDLERLPHRAEEFITNGQANSGVAAMTEYGYDTDHWAEGQDFLDEAYAQVWANEVAFAAHLGKTDVYNAAFDEAWDQTQSRAHLCAVRFEGQTEALRLLGLHKRRDQTTGKSKIAWPKNRGLTHFLPWAHNLYTKAQDNEEASTRLTDFGYPVERLSEEAVAVEAVAQADSEQKITKAEAQQSTVARDEAVDAGSGCAKRRLSQKSRSRINVSCWI